jgi:hypothetical protein
MAKRYAFIFSLMAPLTMRHLPKFSATRARY